MSPEHGTAGHARSSKDQDSLQMSLFEADGWAKRAPQAKEERLKLAAQ